MVIKTPVVQCYMRLEPWNMANTFNDFILQPAMLNTPAGYFP